jgi:hydroxymethylpyrimidine kinase/phosphomethylpyrimidine kinase
MKSALTIAASDPSGGAGIQADLRAFSYMGVHGCSVVTCVTAQNTQKLYQINAVPQMAVEGQLNAILEDIKISACKTGMLYSPRIVELVAKKAEAFDFPLIVDPVMKATVGGSLHDSGFIEALKNKLIPKATLFTPNIPEAEVILGEKINSIDDMKDAAKKLHTSGCKLVLLKGGHLKGFLATDILYDGKETRIYMSKSYPKDLHGTGCTFSALITAMLAKGKEIEEAVSEAKFHMGNIIEHGYAIGKGVGIAGVVPQPSFSPEELAVMEALHNAVYEVQEMLSIFCVPEVGINIGFALPRASSLDDVCALEGRLVRVGESIGHIGGLKFGASKHIARIILTAMKYDPETRSAMNIKYHSVIIDVCSSLGFEIGTFDRKKEPRTTATMEWGTETAIKQMGKVPDIIYDEGGWGKEAMIRILGKNPQDVVGKLRIIIKECRVKE